MYKIIISPSKSFDLSKPCNKGLRPMFLDQAKTIFKQIKELSLEETKELYNLSDKLAVEVFDMHKNHGQVYYRAIDMYKGLVFKQLKIDEYDLEWLNEHVVILDALYGIVKPLDLIAPYRLDFNNKMITSELRKIWEVKINEYLKNYEIYNLASNEFSSLINKKMILPIMDESINQIKIKRGVTLHNIVTNKKILH